MYEVNDWVRIKNNFWNIKPTVALGITPEMQMLARRECQIKKVGHNGIKTRYRVTLNTFQDWVWDERWLEPLTEFKDVQTYEIDKLLFGE